MSNEAVNNLTGVSCVTAFHAHLNVVTSLDYVDTRDCFVSASDDMSLRMWTVYGAYLGVFGQETPWLPPVDLEPSAPPALPQPATVVLPPSVTVDADADVDKIAAAAMKPLSTGGHYHSHQWFLYSPNLELKTNAIPFFNHLRAQVPSTSHF